MKRRILPLLFCILMPFSFAFSACSGGVQESTEPSSQEISKSESKAEESLLGSEAESANGDASEGNDDKSEFTDESNNDKSESDTSDGDGEYDGDTGNAPITRPSGYPTLCGSFMQPYAFKDYSEAQMISHLQAMYDVGIDILILQWSFTTENGVVTDAYFESSFEENEYSADCDKSGAKLVETILSAAEKVGVKVFVGLNDSAEWWQKGVLDRAWLDKQSELGIKGARQLYSAYKQKYPNAFHGWYFVFEFYNMQASKTVTDNAAYLLNLFREPLKELDSGMPMMLSPYISASGASPEDTGRLWSEVFKNTGFIEGDIFCCQDSVGAGHISMEQLEPYYAEIKKAVDNKKGLLFWANNEDFTQSTWSTAPFDRFIEQLKITDKYVSAHITFAYSHHQHPDMQKIGHHLAYKAYYETGSIPKSSLPAPKAEVSTKSDGSVIVFEITAQNRDKLLYGIRIYKNGIETEFKDYTLEYGKDSYVYSFTDSNISGDGEAVYEICAVDYYNNNSEPFKYIAKYTAKNGENIALGKSYTLVTPPEASYPDESGNSLTDGKYGSAEYFDKAFCGFLGKAEMVFDLGSKTEGVYAVGFSTLGGGSAAVYHPNAISVFASDDGVNFKPVKSESYPADLGIDSLNTQKRTLFLGNELDCRYLKIVFTTNQSWIFVDEIEIYAEK
ncbi:MAG: DUF4434 domain-containing protein [Clostridia bacterium]|nr:DUF4434 domain-containing protein [Clostridia bacterium]